MKKNTDRLINTGWDRIHYLFIALLMTLVGGLYVSGLQPAYDPSILKLSPSLVFVEYLGLFVGGLAIFGSFALHNKVWTLNVQFWGLLLQTLAALAVGISVLFVGASPFILIFVVVVAGAHSAQLFTIRRELKNAPVKREIAEKVPAPSAGGDLMVQTMVFLQNRVDRQDEIIRELRASGAN